MKGLFILVLLATPAFAGTEEIAKIAGHYTYTEYSVALPNGRTIDLVDLGATSATLDVDAGGTLTLQMTMEGGKKVTSTAKVLECHFANGSGYWLAQWADMSYPVRAMITARSGTLLSVTKFDNAADTERYRSVERATLSKVAR